MTYGKDEEAILVLKVHSATDLPEDLIASPYVMAAIVSGVSNPNWVKTSIDEKGGANPKSDFVILFPVNQEMVRILTNFYLMCKIMDSGKALGDGEIGNVIVPLPELLAVAGSAAGENYKTYPVVSGKEERGRIVISHKLVGDIPAPPLMGVQEPNQNPPIEFLNTITYVPYPLSHDHNPILELFFHHGIDLPHPSYSRKGRLYVKAAIDHPNTKPNWVKTVTDENGGENPVWDYMIHFPLNQEMVRMPTNFNLVCKIKHSGKNLGHRKIGHVKVRLQDLLAGAATGENISIHYPVEASGGGKKGKIVISHRLLTNTAGISAPPPVGVQDPNHGAEPNTAVDGIKIAARVSTIAAAIINIFADLA